MMQAYFQGRGLEVCGDEVECSFAIQFADGLDSIVVVVTERLLSGSDIRTSDQVTACPP